MNNYVQTGCIFSLLLIIVCAGCSYQRGKTHYAKGTVLVSQPLLLTPEIPNRTFKGIRVAGSDTDILPEFWDNKLKRSGELATFEFFEARYHDLLVYNTEAAESALNSFKHWGERRRLSYNFKIFWRTRK